MNYEEKAGENVPFREKISYGIGAMSNEFQLTIIGTYLLIFMTDVMQISPMVAGGVFLAGGICDAFTDLIITNIADKTHTKWGKYRPWILAGIPLAACFALNFIYPGFAAGNSGRVVWCYVIYLLTVPVLQTCFICPYITMNNVMSRDSADRLDFASCRTVGENLADILVNALVMTIVLSVGTSFKDLAGWRAMALLFAGLIIVTAVIGFLGTKERVHVTNTDAEGNELSIWAKIGLYKGNRAACKMLIITTAFYFFFAFSSIMFSYFCIHNLGHEDWMASLSTVSIVAQAAVVCTLPWLGRHYEKRTLVSLGCILLMFAFGLCLFMDSYSAVLVYQIIKGAGLGLVGSLIWSMWPELADYTTARTGIAAPGIIMAVGTFFMKIGTAFSSFACSWILDLCGYDGVLDVQAPGTLAAIRLSFALIPAVCVAITMAANVKLRELAAVSQ